MAIERLIEICKLSHQDNPLLSLQVEIGGFEAYKTICANLGIPPIMSHHAYRGARSDLAERHIKSLLDAWGTSQGIRAVAVSIMRDGKDRLVLTPQGGVPQLVFHAPHPPQDGNFDRLPRIVKVILKFSYYWSLL